MIPTKEINEQLEWYANRQEEIFKEVESLRPEKKEHYDLLDALEALNAMKRLVDLGIEAEQNKECVNQLALEYPFALVNELLNLIKDEEE